MPVIVVVGVQWGDEGKGKVVDFVTDGAQLVVRFQGGNNAGHTVVVDGTKTALQLIPSGILRADTRCLLATGVVVNPWSILGEMEKLKDAGIEVSPARLGIGGEVHLILPYHQAIDAAREALLGATAIGTTGKGIGPAYEDMVSRAGIRLIDLFDSAYLRDLVERNVSHANKYLSAVLASDKTFSADEMLNSLQDVGSRLKPYIANVSKEVARAVKSGKKVVFEGAQGSLLDISHGTYPYVTSSHTVAAFAPASAGVGPQAVDSVVGICKAYCTRVGSGPFPTEDGGEDGTRLRERGREFGTVTGRPRRCGWFDAVAAERAIRLNGIDSLVVTKLDVLTGFKSLKIGRSYRLDGQLIDDLPVSSRDIARLSVDYEELPGWEEDLSKVRSFSALPQNARAFVEAISKVTQTEIAGFSVGPERDQTILLKSFW